MLIFIGVTICLAFISWLIWRVVKRRAINAHMVCYILSCVAGIYTFAFFLNMDLPEMVKILACIILGAALIFIAAWFQRRSKLNQP